MRDQRPYVLSIAGFDPSAGAGILADVKTFEQCNVYGMGVISALTNQNDVAFSSVEWLSLPQIIGQIEVLQKRFQFEYIKIGLIENLETLYQLILQLTSNLQPPKLIWDPILKASAGFEFHTNINQKMLEESCKKLYLITPNVPEAMKLGPWNDPKKNAMYLSQFCNVYLKGGHWEENKGMDILFTVKKKQIEFRPESKHSLPKHGSGCVLSSAITANLAKGLDLEEACAKAKKYTTHFLLSNKTMLGYHSNVTVVEHE